MDVKVRNTKTVRSYIIRYFGANQIADFWDRATIFIFQTSMSVPLVHLHALGVASTDKVVSTAGVVACHPLAQRYYLLVNQNYIQCPFLSSLRRLNCTSNIWKTFRHKRRCCHTGHSHHLLIFDPWKEETGQHQGEILSTTWGSAASGADKRRARHYIHNLHRSRAHGGNRPIRRQECSWSRRPWDCLQRHTQEQHSGRDQTVCINDRWAAQ